MWVTEYLSSPEPQDLDPSVTDLCRGSFQTAWLITHAGAWHVSFAGMASLHPSKSGDNCMTLPGFRKASAGKAEGVPATGLVKADSSVPVLDCRSGTAPNTCMSHTAKLLLLFLPATHCSNQWCVSITEGTSLLPNCIFLWWELPPFTCYSLVLFCCCSPLKLSEPNSTQGSVWFSWFTHPDLMSPFQLISSCSGLNWIKIYWFLLSCHPVLTFPFPQAEQLSLPSLFLFPLPLSPSWCFQQP